MIFLEKIGENVEVYVDDMLVKQYLSICKVWRRFLKP